LVQFLLRRYRRFCGLACRDRNERDFLDKPRRREAANRHQIRAVEIAGTFYEPE
jgi:hypothetical protein